MPAYKVTFYFNQLARGFSESYYFDLDDIDLAANRAEFFAARRALILARDVTFEAIKVQGDEAAALGSYFSVRSLTYPNTGLAGDVTAAGALVQINGQRKYHRSLCLRGLPDDWIVRTLPGSALRLTPAGRGAIDTFLENFDNSAHMLRIRRRQNDGNPGEVVNSIVAGTGNVSTLEVVTANPIIGIENFEKVIFSGGRRTTRAMNGIQTVLLNFGLGRYRIALPWGKLFGFSPLDMRNLKMRRIVPAYVPVSDAYFVDVRTRKSGRAFFVPRGRARNRPA